MTYGAELRLTASDHENEVRGWLHARHQCILRVMRLDAYASADVSHRESLSTAVIVRVSMYFKVRCCAKTGT
jgi:hypothetical protein